MKHILDVGNCGPDHASLNSFFTKNFDCQVAQADNGKDAKSLLAKQEFDLVVVNRKLDIDYSDGLDVIRQIKADAATAHVPVMLITNYPEHQDAAVQIGALRGFGKLELEDPQTVVRVGAAMG